MLEKEVLLPSSSSSSRNLDQVDGVDNYAYLVKYNLKFVHCFRNTQVGRTIVDDDPVIQPDPNSTVSTTRSSGHGIGGGGGLGVRRGLESSSSSSSAITGSTYKNEPNSATGSVMFRLCPSEGGCDPDDKFGCREGYGDFVMDLETYVKEYFIDQEANIQWDDDTFSLTDYIECKEYVPSSYYNNELSPSNDNTQQTYYIGPSCVNNGNDIGLELFIDKYCTLPASSTPASMRGDDGLDSVTFEDLSNENGGLVSTYCMDCLEIAQDGSYTVRDMCYQDYIQSTTAKCESKMEYYNYFGKDESGCDTIIQILKNSLPKISKGYNNNSTLIGILAALGGLLLVVVGLVSLYTVGTRKKNRRKQQQNN